MVDEVLDRMRGFSLIDEEVSGLQLEQEDVASSKEECLRSLIGKVHGDKVQIWIQVWNIPNHWISRGTGMTFAKIFGKVQDVFIPDTGSKKGRHIKILATVDLNRQLLRGTFINLGDKSVWVEFKYEQIASFCFYCGTVGHSEKKCQRRKVDTENGKLKEDQYGDWMRAEQFKMGQKKAYDSTFQKRQAESNGEQPIEEIRNGEERIRLSATEMAIQAAKILEEHEGERTGGKQIRETMNCEMRNHMETTRLDAREMIKEGLPEKEHNLIIVARSEEEKGVESETDNARPMQIETAVNEIQTDEGNDLINIPIIDGSLIGECREGRKKNNKNEAAREQKDMRKSGRRWKRLEDRDGMETSQSKGTKLLGNGSQKRQ